MPELKKINFSKNWNNKLRNACYTTFRMYYPGKYRVGEEVDITLNGTHMHTAKIVAVQPMDLHKVNAFVSHLDAALEVEEFKKQILAMYKYKYGDVSSKLFCLILLQAIPSEQTNLFATGNAELLRKVAQ